MFDLVLKGGHLVSHTNTLHVDLAIKDGKVKAILSPGTDVKARNEIDVTGKYIMPGAVDVHVHAGFGEPHRETLKNASMAAAAGGITTILDQPLSNPTTVTVQAFNAKLAEAKEACVVDFGIWGGLIPGHLDDLQPMFTVGAQAYKAFMCRCSNYPMTNDGVLLEGMKRIGELGGLVAVHAENDTLIYELVDQFAAQGKNDIQAFLAAHPPYSELEAINRFIFLAKLAPKCKAHIVHMSIPQGAQAIKEAKAQGVNITAETSPQYLGLTEDDLYQKGGVAKCDPPVRSKDLVDKLWTYVLDGSIDIVATDHSPHPFEKKVVPLDSFDTASEGVTGLQTMIPVLLDEGVHQRGMSLNRLAELTAYNPAQRFGLQACKGELVVGKDADFYVLDINKDWTCHAEEMFYVNKHTPFADRTFKGLIEKTFVRGQLVYEGGAIKGEPGYGQFIKMNMKA